MASHTPVFRQSYLAPRMGGSHFLNKGALLEVLFVFWDTSDDSHDVSLLFKADGFVQGGSISKDGLLSQTGEVPDWYGYDLEKEISHKDALALLKRMVAKNREIPELFVGFRY